MNPCLSQLDTGSLSLQPCREDKTLGKAALFSQGQPLKRNSAESCKPPILSRAGVMSISILEVLRGTGIEQFTKASITIHPLFC